MWCQCCLAGSYCKEIWYWSWKHKIQNDVGKTACIYLVTALCRLSANLREQSSIEWRCGEVLIIEYLLEERAVFYHLPDFHRLQSESVWQTQAVIVYQHLFYSASYLVTAVGSIFYFPFVMLHQFLCRSFRRVAVDNRRQQDGHCWLVQTALRWRSPEAGIVSASGSGLQRFRRIVYTM